MNRQAKHLLEFGHFRIDLDERVLMRDRETITLSPKAFETLLVLAQHSERLVLKDDLMKTLWPDTFVEESNLSQHIFQLRKALGEKAHDPQYIVTVPGRGYRFAQKVTELSEANGDLVVQSSSIQRVTIEEDSAAEPSPQVPVGRNWKRVTGILVAALSVVAVVSVGLQRWKLYSGSFNLEKMEIAKLTDSGTVASVAISPDGRYVVYAVRQREGLGLWTRQVATRSDVQILPADAIDFEGLTFSPDGNYIYYVRADKNDPGFHYLYVTSALGGPSRMLIRDIDSPVSFSPDGQRFVYTRGIPTRNAIDVRIANSDGTDDHLLSRIEKCVQGFHPGPTWSPDGRAIAVSFLNYGKQSYVLDTVSVADGSVRELYAGSHAIGRALWMPEGDRLLLVMGDQNQHGQLWTISYPKAEVRRVTNDLTDYRMRADLTRDAKTMVAIEDYVISNIWVAPAANPSQAQQITSLALPMLEVVEAPDGRLLAAGGDERLWSLQADGSHRTLFTDSQGVASPRTCGRFVVFSSSRTTASDIIRADVNGENLAKLVTGNLGSHVCTPDGKYVFYEEMGPPHRISRIPVEGGAPVQIAPVLGEFLVGRLSMSPDGKRLAYPYEEYSPAPTLKLAIITAEGGPPMKVLTAPGGAYAYGALLWSPDGKSLQFLLTRNGATNIWEQPLAGGEPKQLTKFTSGRIFDFNWSADHKDLLLARGDVSSDVVLLSNFR